MKKSEVYRQAQGAVMANAYISIDDKLEILRVLMNDEDVAKYCEERAAEKEVEKDA